MSATNWGNFVSDQGRIEKYFEDYVFGFMQTDIQREIELAHSGEQAGKFLCALGLLCYTEAMGFIIKGEKSKPAQRFNAFLEMMGNEYKSLLEKNPDIYASYRSKMAHVYFATDCIIFMLKDADINATIGIGVLPDGEKYFCVEKYFIDFNRACHKLYDELVNRKRSGGYLPST